MCACVCVCVCACRHCQTGVAWCEMDMRRGCETETSVAPQLRFPLGDVGVG